MDIIFITIWEESPFQFSAACMQIYWPEKLTFSSQQNASSAATYFAKKLLRKNSFFCSNNFSEWPAKRNAFVCKTYLYARGASKKPRVKGLNKRLKSWRAGTWNYPLQSCSFVRFYTRTYVHNWKQGMIATDRELLYFYTNWTWKEEQKERERKHTAKQKQSTRSTIGLNWFAPSAGYIATQACMYVRILLAANCLLQSIYV